jgi:DNA polymerase-3 subunit epsilon
MYITAIDFETAWYQPHSAIALGITRIRDNQVIETKSWLFRPPGRRVYIRPNFIDIHGIRPEHLRDKPDFAGVWPEIAPYFETASMLLAHNAPFDKNVLYATTQFYGITLPAFDWNCTVRISRVKWPDIENHKLSTVCRHLGIPLRHHDPASDAEGCANIYLQACKAA